MGKSCVCKTLTSENLASENPAWMLRYYMFLGSHFKESLEDSALDRCGGRRNEQLLGAGEYLYFFEIQSPSAAFALQTE